MYITTGTDDLHACAQTGNVGIVHIFIFAVILLLFSHTTEILGVNQTIVFLRPQASEP